MEVTRFDAEELSHFTLCGTHSQRYSLTFELQRHRVWFRSTGIGALENKTEVNGPQVGLPLGY